MKRILLVLIITTGFFYNTVCGQNSVDYLKIDILLARGEYEKVIDTCKQVLATDSLNSEIYYKMGLAYQNFLPDDKSFDFFLQAFALAPDNNLFKYMVAKGYFNKSKNNLARPLLQSLCSADSMNWSYAYYLTSIYLQEGKYDESIEIYKRFYNRDSPNYIVIDKMGFAFLRKGEFSRSIDLFNRSLALNKKNNNAIKNLAYLYSNTHKIDTAIQLLTRGIATDPTDMDLYERRAALYFSTNNNKRALNDYLKILGSGDSTFLYLKRAGIGYTNNLQPKEANVYFLIACKKDSTDIESLNYLARNYHQLNDLKKSEFYYNKLISVLSPFSFRLGISHVMLAEVYKADGMYNQAIESYLKGQKLGPDMNINMIIANIYDEKLDNDPKAIYYYQLFINGLKDARMVFGTDYVESVRKRLEFLKEKQLESVKK